MRLYSAIHVGKYMTEDKLKTEKMHKLNTTQKKQVTQNTAKQNYPGLVAFYDTQRRSSLDKTQ